MVVILALAGIVGRPYFPNLVSSFPAPSPSHLGASSRWNVRQVQPLANPYEIENPNKGCRVRVQGGWHWIKPTPEYSHVEEVLPASDGTLLIHRSTSGDAYSIYQDSILKGGREHVVPYGVITAYRDSNNYAGNRPEGSWKVDPSGVPTAFEVRSGKLLSLGLGTPRLDGKDGLTVLETSVNENLRPGGWQVATGIVTTIAQNNKSISIPNYSFLARDADGTVILQSGAGASMDSSGYAFTGKRAPADVSLMRVKNLKIQNVQSIPKPWTLDGRSPAGWYLLRRIAPRKTPDFVPRGTAKEIDAQVRSFMNESMSDYGERVWDFAILKGNTISPITFDRPKGTEKLLWRNGCETLGNNALRFVGFWGNDVRYFRLSPSS